MLYQEIGFPALQKGGQDGNGNASFSGPHVAVGNLRVSQTECPPGYATRITNIAKPPCVSAVDSAAAVGRLSPE
jgi:hypothetical protein